MLIMYKIICLKCIKILDKFIRSVIVSLFIPCKMLSIKIRFSHKYLIVRSLGLLYNKKYKQDFRKYNIKIMITSNN